MKLLGYPELGAEKFICVNGFEEIVQSHNHVICIKQNIKLLQQCLKAGLQTGLWVCDKMDVIWGLNAKPHFLLARMDTSKDDLQEWHSIVQDYLSDCLLVKEIDGSKEQLYECLSLRLDAVVLTTAILKK